MPNHVPLSTAMVDHARNPRRLIMPPPMTQLVNEAVRLGYEIPDVEEGDASDAQGNAYPAVKVTLNGNALLADVEAFCRVVPGPEPVRERVRWAARSALAEALRLAKGADAARTES